MVDPDYGAYRGACLVACLSDKCYAGPFNSTRGGRTRHEQKHSFRLPLLHSVGIAAGLRGRAWLAWPRCFLAIGLTIIGGVVAIGAVLWPAIVFFTRAQSLKDTVGHLKGTTVVTDAASANALPNNKDVVAATPEIVAAIQKAQ